MAKDEELELDGGAAGGKKGKSGVMRIVLIVVVALLVIGVSITTTLLLMGGSDKDKGEAGEEKGEKAMEAAKPKPVFYKTLEPPFVVNFEDQGHVRFLQVGIDVMVNDELMVPEIDKHMPVIRNNIVLLLSSQGYADISSREGKEKLRAQTLSEIQAILKKRTGKPGVEEVYFTSFVIQ